MILNYDVYITAITYTGFEILNSKNDFAIFNYLAVRKNIQDIICGGKIICRLYFKKRRRCHYTRFFGRTIS